VTTYITKSKEYFTLTVSKPLKDLLTKRNEDARKETRDQNKEAYSITQRKTLGQIETDIKMYDSLFENIQYALKNNNIPICRTIDLKQKSVQAPYPNPCTKRSATRCTLNPYCEIDPTNNTIPCKLKTFNEDCKNILEADGTDTGYTVTSMYLSPTMMKEVNELSIIK
jgi:hypothetical protein